MNICSFSTMCLGLVEQFLIYVTINHIIKQLDFSHVAFHCVCVRVYAVYDGGETALAGLGIQSGVLCHYSGSGGQVAPKLLYSLKNPSQTQNTHTHTHTQLHSYTLTHSLTLSVMLLKCTKYVPYSARFSG